MSVYSIDPISDARWHDFISSHPSASVFHSPGWLEALRRTYGYRLAVLTTSPSGNRLTSGLPICLLDNWIGDRLVSLPFSDHCEPLIDRPEDRAEILSHLNRGIERGSWRNVELRPATNNLLSEDEALDHLQPAHRFCFHTLDLTPPHEDLYQQLHHSCIRRAIRKAEREQLEYRSGVSSSLLSDFYQLVRVTRRRHGLLPQPFAWFENVVACLGDAVTIRVAAKGSRPIAAIMTLTFNRTMVYKYGCSDARYHNLRAMALLFWRAIEEAKQQGLKTFDLGRSDLDQPGLIAFKDRLGARRSMLTYYRQPGTTTRAIENRRSQQAARWLFGRLPDAALTLAGRLVYRHLG